MAEPHAVVDLAGAAEPQVRSERRDGFVLYSGCEVDRQTGLLPALRQEAFSVGQVYIPLYHKHLVSHAGRQHEFSPLHDCTMEGVRPADIEVVAFRYQGQQVGECFDRRVAAYIYKYVDHRLPLAQHSGAAGLVVPEWTAVRPDGVVTVEAVLPAVCDIARDYVRPRLVCRRAHHEFVDLRCVCEVCELLEFGRGVAELGVRERLA